MLNLFKIAVLFPTLLIAFINSGLYKVDPSSLSISSDDRSSPASQTFSFPDYFLCTNPDLASKNKPGPCKSDRYLQKFTLWQYFANNAPIDKNLKRNHDSFLENPVLKVKVFGPSDICYPFNYFW